MKKHKEKNKRTVIQNFEDVLKEENEPYSSIIKILYVAPTFNKEFKLMKTRELNELIVKRYKISIKRRDKRRYPLFLELKEKLKKYPDIHLNQDIEPDKSIPESENTSSNYHRFESILRTLIDKGFIERPKRGYCRLSEKFISNPFNNWIKDFISECKLENSATWWNSYLFMPKININELEDEEIIELKCLLHKTLDSYSRINDFLGKFGYKKANKLWEEYLENCNCSNFTKFRFWLYLIEKNFITSIQFYRVFHKYKNKSNSQKEKLSMKDVFFDISLLTELRYSSYVDTFLKDEDIDNWQESFSKIFEIAFVNYIKSNINKKKISFVKEKYFTEYNENINDLHNVLIKTIKVIGGTGYSMLVFFPDFLVHQVFENLGMQKKQSTDLEKAVKYNYNRHPFVEKFFKSSDNQFKKLLIKEKLNPDIDIDIIKNTKNQKDKDTGIVSFFKETKFFNELEYKLIELGFNDLDEFFSALNSHPDFSPIPKIK